jgi:ATP-binding cassette subfamily F protein uup
VGTLSGGERRRLQLLLVLAGRPNVLFLDEPTNNLDLDTIRILEEFLEAWPGALVVVSHDRTFLDRTTDRLVGLDQDGVLAPVAGGLTAWIELAERQGPRRRTGSKDASSQRRSAPSTNTRRSASTIYRELRDAEKEIARLERQRSELETSMQSAIGHLDLARVGAELTEVQAALEHAEHRWLELGEESDQRG